MINTNQEKIIDVKNKNMLKYVNYLNKIFVLLFPSNNDVLIKF